MVAQRLELLTNALYPVVRVWAKKGVGSGTIVYSKPGGGGEYDTYILTNHHVIEDLLEYKKEWDTVLQKDVKREIKSAARVEEFRYKTGRTEVVGEQAVQADIVAYDARQDLALLKLRDDKRYEYVARLPQRNSKIEMLTPVCCVGCGMGQRPLMTVGHVSGIGIEIENYDYHLSTAPSIFGVSGGAVFNAETLEFLGVPSRITVRHFLGFDVVTHMGYYIPVWRVFNFLDEQCYQFIYDDSYTPEQCDKTREEKRNKAQWEQAQEAV